MGDVGKLLELHGVPVTSFEGANQYTLMHELAQGHQVIVALDSGEIWAPGIWERLMDFLGFSGADHALIVSGIDASNPDGVQVVVTDPGTGEVTRYPYERFADAWKDSNFHMVATNEAPLDSPALQGFDGMLDTIMGMSCEDWLNAFGDAVQAGVELTGEVADFLESHPELERAGLAVGGMLMSRADDCVVFAAVAGGMLS